MVAASLWILVAYSMKSNILKHWIPLPWSSRMTMSTIREVLSFVGVRSILVFSSSRLLLHSFFFYPYHPLLVICPTITDTKSLLILASLTLYNIANHVNILCECDFLSIWRWENHPLSSTWILKSLFFRLVQFRTFSRLVWFWLCYVLWDKSGPVLLFELVSPTDSTV